MRVNKGRGFDCPGCAWGDDNHSTFSFCENGAKAVSWEATRKAVEPEFFAQHSVSKLREQSDYFLEYQGRLTHPMRYNRTTDHYEPISWDAAFSLIASHLKGLESPDQADFYTSGRASNEASYLYQVFGRMFGTNNFPDCSNMCHEASGSWPETAASASAKARSIWTILKKPMPFSSSGKTRGLTTRVCCTACVTQPKTARKWSALIPCANVVWSVLPIRKNR